MREYFGAIALTSGDLAIVSIEDWERLSEHKWYASRAGGKTDNPMIYAIATHKGQNIRMHRLIANAPKGLLVDHINRDSLDNRRHNLRVTTNGVNMVNAKDRKRALPRNVYRSRNAFTVDISRNKKRVFLRYCRTVQEAVFYRDEFLNNEKRNDA